MRRAIVRRLLAAGLLVAALGAGGGAAAQDKPRLLAPRGAGPFPVVLLVPGCSGFAVVAGVDIFEERARELAAAGYLVAFVDFLGRRGLKTCAGAIGHAAVGKDVIEAARWARTLPNADPTRIHAVGWSFGGGGILAALATLPAGGTLLAKVVLICPDCTGARPWPPSTSALLLLGGLDDVTPPARCDAIVKGSAPGKVKAVTYPDARHAFDMRSLPERAQYQFGTIGHNPAAAKAAKAEMMLFLR